MATFIKLTSWNEVFSGPLGKYILGSCALRTLAYIILYVRLLSYLLTQIGNGDILCFPTSSYMWFILLIIFACFLVFIDIPLCCCMFSVEDDTISRKTYGFIVLFIMAISICLSSITLIPFSDRDVLIFRISDTDEFGFQLEFNGEMERIFTIFFSVNDQNLPEEFDGLNCTFVGAHDLCPTWGPLLYMNATKFFRCPPDSISVSIESVFNSRNLLWAKENVRTMSYPIIYMSICFIIFISMTISSLLMIAYRRFVAPDQWFDTRLKDFVERHRSSMPGLLSSLATDFLPSFLRSLVGDSLATSEAIE
jgi:hypothetical protein